MNSKHKEYYDKRKEKHKEYYQKRRENLEWVEEQKIVCKKYKENNRDKVLEKQRNYKKTYIGQRNHKISEWRTKGGLKETQERMIIIFDRWLNCLFCESCGCEFEKKNFKCMDHDRLSGHFRQVICNRCNCFRNKFDRQRALLMLEIHRLNLRL